jgi:hypothetical protein
VDHNSRLSFQLAALGPTKDRIANDAEISAARGRGFAGDEAKPFFARCSL